MAALLIQNRTKTGQQKVLEPEGATPSQAQPQRPSGSFDLLEVTAVGGARPGENESSGAGKGAAENVAARKTYPTPGGGLPGLLARTQLGLGDAVRAFRESAARPDAPAPAVESRAEASSTVAAAPTPTGEVSPVQAPPLTPPDEAASDAGEGAAAVSGPVFDLATGPVEAGGPVSGPVFDLVSGPFSGPATTVSPPNLAAVEAPTTGATPAPSPEQGAPRRATLTPASGRLAALLAESRKRTGRHETVDKGTEPSVSGAGGVVAAPNAASTSSGAAHVSQPVPEDVATMRVPGAELAQKKGPGFAATLLGLPAPELTPPVLPTGDAGATMGSREGPVRGGYREASAHRNTPEPIEGDATERSLLSTGDLRARWGRSSEEQKRTTEIVDIVRPNRSAIKTAALILGGAAVLVVILVAVARVNRSGRDETAATTTAPPAPSPSASTPGKPAAPREAPAAAEEQAGAAAARAQDEAPVGEAPVGQARVGEAARAEREAARDEEKPAAAAEAEATAPRSPALGRDNGPATAARSGDGEAKRKVARSESRRSDSRRAETKTRRRTLEGRSARPEGTATAASYETPRQRVAQPLRPLQADPDGTLPLGMQ